MLTNYVTQAKDASGATASVDGLEVIRQRVYEGKRFREIAETLQCPLNTALARMHEGLKRLRLLWEKDHA